MNRSASQWQRSIAQHSGEAIALPSPTMGRDAYVTPRAYDLLAEPRLQMGLVVSGYQELADSFGWSKSGIWRFVRTHLRLGLLVVNRLADGRLRVMTRAHLTGLLGQSRALVAASVRTLVRGVSNSLERESSKGSSMVRTLNRERRPSSAGEVLAGLFSFLPDAPDPSRTLEGRFEVLE